MFNCFIRKPVTLTDETSEEWIKMCKKEFNINYYNDKYVMHCKTKKEYDDFVECWAKQNIRDAEFFKDRNIWRYNGENTCIKFATGTYASINYYTKNGYIVLEWEDFMGKKEKEYTAIGHYQKFRKENLKNNDIVTFRNGKRGIVFIELETIVTEDFNDYVRFSSMTSELTCSHAEDWDIIKIQRPNYIEAPVVWEREETVEMTLAEVCKALGKNVKIVKE